MKYIIPLIACSLLFTQCRTNVNVQPTGSYDTLGIQWMTIERDNITYYFQGTGVKGASIYTDLYEDAYNKLKPVFNAQLPCKIRFFVWTDWEEAQQKLNHFPGFAVPEKCICHVRVNQTLGHEMTHILSFWANGMPPIALTRFVNEGVAVAFDLAGDDKMETAREALTGQDIHSIAELWSGSNQSVSDDVFYSVAGAFMDYLYKQDMRNKYFLLLKNQTMQSAEKIYGKEQLQSLIADFESRVGL